MKNLFHSLIWPAVAGNVAWAFFTLAIGEEWSDEGVQARLAVLLLLAIYLGVNWVRTESIDDVKSGYWAADGVHVISIVVFAIASHLNKAWLQWSLVSVLVITVCGHLLGAWEKRGATNQWLKRFWLAGCNAVGLVVIPVSYALFPQPYPWNLPAAVGAVLIAWWFARSKLKVS